VIQYATTLNGTYSSVDDVVRNGNVFQFNVNTTFITTDMSVDLFFRVLDSSANISTSQKVNYYSNRSAQPPVITTNNGN